MFKFVSEKYILSDFSWHCYFKIYYKVADCFNITVQYVSVEEINKIQVLVHYD